MSTDSRNFRVGFVSDDRDQPSGGAQGQATDIAIQAERVMKMKQRLNTILASNTGKSVEEITRDCERDYFMTAAEACQYGLIDKVIENR